MSINTDTMDFIIYSTTIILIEVMNLNSKKQDISFAILFTALIVKMKKKNIELLLAHLISKIIIEIIKLVLESYGITLPYIAEELFGALFKFFTRRIYAWYYNQKKQD